MSKADTEIHLGVGCKDLVVLHPGATAPTPQQGYSGLYHMAIHLPSLAEFARVVARVYAAGYGHSPTDHLEGFGLIVGDPDGIGLELAFDTPQRVQSVSVGPDGHPTAIDINGHRHRMGEPTDLRWLFRQIPDDRVQAPLPAGTIVGHLHLSVGDLDEALAFYRDLIGFTPRFYGGRIGFADMSAGGTVSHRLAVNIWQGRGAPQRAAGTAGMRYFTLVLRSQEDMAAISTRVEMARRPMERRGDEVLVQDPAGNRLLLTTSPASSSSDGKIPS